MNIIQLNIKMANFSFLLSLISLLFKEQIIFPQSAENKDNEWKFIANQKNFKQGIRIEKCR